jgi:hypothetical protein
MLITGDKAKADGKQKIEKALTASDFLSGGLANADRKNEFERMLRGTNDMMKIAKIEYTDTLRVQHDKQYIGRRVLEAGVEATTFTDIKEPDYSTGTTTLAKVTGAFTVSYETLLENIEKKGYLASLTRDFMEKAASDISDLAVNGDTASADTFYAKIDGFYKRAENSYIVDANGATVSKDLFYAGFRGLPKEARRKKSQLKWFANTLLQTDWREVYGDRATLGGDAATIGQTFSPDGIPLVTCDEIADDISVGYTAVTFGEHTGTVYDAFKLVTATNCAITINQTIAGAASGNKALVATAGTYSAPELANHLNVLAVAAGLTACFSAVNGKIRIRTTKSGALEDIEVVAVANSMYTTIGFTAGHYPGVAPAVAGTINRGTYAFLTMPANLVIYIKEEFRTSTEYIARSDEYAFTTHFFVNTRIVDPAALVRVDNVRLLDY